MPKVDGSSIREPFLKGKEISIRVPDPSSHYRELLERNLCLLFKTAGFERYAVEILFCIHELVSNGFKANLKRMFFQRHGLRLDNMEDYHRGMEEFRSFLQSAQECQKLVFSNTDFWVKVKAKKVPKGLQIRVENNATLHYYERLRILEKESRINAIHSISEVLLDSHDTEEGAGLGLLFLFFILKRKLKGSSFTILTEPGITRMELLFPSFLSGNREIWA